MLESPVIPIQRHNSVDIIHVKEVALWRKYAKAIFLITCSIVSLGFNLYEGYIKRCGCNGTE